MNNKYKLVVKAFDAFDDWEGGLDLQLDSKLELEFDTLKEAEDALEKAVKHNYCYGMYIKAYINGKCYFDEMLLP